MCTEKKQTNKQNYLSLKPALVKLLSTFQHYLHSLEWFKASSVCPGWILSSVLILCWFTDSITTGWTQEWPHSITNPWCPKLSVWFPFICASVPLSLLRVCRGSSHFSVSLLPALALSLPWILDWVLLKPAELRSSKLLQHLTLCNACGSAAAVLNTLEYCF